MRLGDGGRGGGIHDVAPGSASLLDGADLDPAERGRHLYGDAERLIQIGGVAISDGAFAETKEVIGRYYLIDAADLVEALRIAVQVPAPFGGVEVRLVQKTG